MTHDDALLERYLLGQAAAAEAETLELTLLEDPSSFEAAEAAELELLERFVRGQLATVDQAPLEARLEGSPRLRERLAFCRALIDIANAPAPRRSWISSLLGGLVSPAARPAWVAATVASVGALWLGSQNVDLRQELIATAGLETQISVLADENEQTRRQLADAQEASRRATEQATRLHVDFSRSQQRISELEERVAKGPARNFATLSLTATTRADSEPPRLVVEAGATHVRFELDLPAEAGPLPLTATVELAGVPVWTENQLAIDRGPLGVIGAFEVPLQSLTVGRYHVVVRTARGIVSTYPFDRGSAHAVPAAQH